MLVASSATSLPIPCCFLAVSVPRPLRFPCRRLFRLLAASLLNPCFSLPFPCRVLCRFLADTSAASLLIPYRFLAVSWPRPLPRPCRLWFSSPCRILCRFLAASSTPGEDHGTPRRGPRHPQASRVLAISLPLPCRFLLRFLVASCRFLAASSAASLPPAEGKRTRKGKGKRERTRPRMRKRKSKR